VTERKSGADISREGAGAQLVPPISDLVHQLAAMD